MRKRQADKEKGRGFPCLSFAEGSASLRGRAAPENEGSRLPATMRIHLVQIETSAADDLLRYGEVAVGEDTDQVVT